MTDPYVLLGVDRGATTRQIRAAYVALIKRHHPDISDRGADGGEALAYVAGLNVAFATLRNHRKRAEYDLRPNTPTERFGSINYSALTQPVPPGHRKDQHALKTLGLGLGLVITTVAIIFILTLSPPRSLIRTGQIAQAGSGNPLPSTNFIPDADELRRIVTTASVAHSEDAAESSRRCFIDATADKQPEAAATCVVFDIAVLLRTWRSGDEGSVTPYFHLRTSRSRHLDALAKWGGDRNEVLDRLWSATLDMMVQEVRETPVEPPSPELVAQANAGVLNAVPNIHVPPNPDLARP